ncbi:ABC transporter substrate-binding protein [Brachybacterium hainanense]|uniref:ABC transporter substrate-binding protein n=1 Tax=Brachybacterium hainanense TaxID=1541174 RepID=A0ABV6REA7_9MICO
MIRPSRRAVVATTTALTAAVLTGCGTTEVPGGAVAAPGEEISDSCAADATETATGPVTLTDQLGRTVELAAPASRVASLEWQQTEDLLTLCVAPVAVADVEGFATWDTAEKLPEDTADLGTRQEPDMDALVTANPDLVVVEVTSEDDPVLGQLEATGIPVLATIGADASDPVGHMRALFTLLGEATGRTARAEAVLAELDATIADARAAVADAGLPTADFLYFDGWIDGGNVAIRPFGPGALFSALGAEVGLNPVWTGETDPQYGLGQTDIEGLLAVGDANLFYTATEDPAGDYVTELEKNSLWTGLPAVQEGRAHPFPTGIWTFGGPRSCEQAIGAYAAIIAGS